MLLLACAVSALAQTDVYTASVPVADQSAASRDAALRDALTQVIAHISGQGAAAGAAAVVARAPQLVQSFGYAPDPVTKQLRLTASFDPRGVDAALNNQNMPVFGVVAGPVEDVAVVVSGLHSGADYARALGALRGVPGVKSLTVMSAGADHISLSVRVEGGAGRLAGAASVGGVLARGEAVPSGALAFTLGR